MKKAKILYINQLDGFENFTVKDEEALTIYLLLINGSDQKGGIKISVQGKRAVVKIYGIVIGTGKQVIELQTIQEHVLGNSQSKLFIKCALFDEARLNYHGLIKIGKDAVKSDASQKNQNLLLSPKACVLHRPDLEIAADDVCCAHASSTGKIWKEQLFYLANRGLSKENAEKALICSFLEEFVRGLPKENMENIDKKIKEVIENNYT